jgi:hypothetical protein
MLCNVLLYFTIVFSDGHTEPRTKWMSRDVAEYFVKDIPNNPYIKEDGIEEVKDFKIVDVPPYDCFKGPQ